MFRNKRAILELQVTNWRECRRRRYRRASRISLQIGCRSRLRQTGLSKEAGGGNQANCENLQTSSSEPAKEGAMIDHSKIQGHDRGLAQAGDQERLERATLLGGLQPA